LKKAIIILIISFFGTAKLSAQSDLSFNKVNELSLIYYYASEWDSLINIGHAANKENIDYYYLNYRVGVAYFFKENYFTSTYYFEKAISQNSQALKDDYFRLTYYKALLFSKQNNKIIAIRELHDSILDTYPAPYLGEVDAFYFVGNITKPIQEEELRFSSGNLYSETYYQQSINIFGVGGSLLLNENIGLDIRYSRANLGMIAAIENMEYFYLRNFTIQQNSFNVKPSVFLGSKHRVVIYSNISFLKGDIFAPIDSTNREYDFIKTKESSIALGIEYNYLYKNISLGVNAIVFNYSNDENIQVGASVLWYPKGNLNLYSYTAVSAINTWENEPRLIFQQKIGMELMDNLWLEVNGYYGDVHNLVSISSNYSFEIANHTYGIVSAELIYTVNPKLSFFIDNQYWWRYTGRKQIEIDNSEKIDIINYQQYNLIGGLKWNF